jgi:hypothetical protein
VTPKLRRLLATAALTATAASAVAAAPASAGPVVPLDGVRTSLHTAPATTTALLENGIVPLPVTPTRVGLAATPDGLSIRYDFPITGGRVDAETLAGRINHSGGLRFVSVKSGASLKLTKFRILVNGRPGVTAIVNGDPDTRVRILNLDLSDAKVRRSLPIVRIRGVEARLTATAAGALNATFGTELFRPGLQLGTANVVARVAG